jgi:hypothetical protein
VVAAHGDVVRCRSGRRKAAVECGSRARELTKVLEEWDIEVRVVLLRARNRTLKHRAGLSSVMMRWRPASAWRKPWRAQERTAGRGYGGGQG